MRKLALGVTSVCAAALMTGNLPTEVVGAAAQQQALVIQGGTLVDTANATTIPNSVIVVQGNRITAVGRQGQVQVPAGAQVINAGGKWVTPGLVDAKANWNWPYNEAFLYWGVTSAMITGARNNQGIAERDAINHGIFPGPRLYQGVLNLAGPGRDGNRPDNYIPSTGNKVVRNAEDARQWVRTIIDGGADFIGTPDGDGDPAIFAAIADEAHKHGKGVVMRCVGPQTRGRECVLAGADIMIHTGNIGNQIAKDEAKWANYVGLPPDPYCDMDEAKKDAMITFLLQHDTAPEPDFIAADRGFPSSWARIQQEDRDVFNDPNLRAYYPQFMIQDLWQNVQSPEEYLTPEVIAVRKCGFQNHARFIGELIARGGHALVASDITQSAPGLGLHQEAAVFQEDAKVPPMKVLQAMTSWTAHHFKINDIGVVAPGKLADIVIVDADPTADILNMRKINTVIKDGKIHERKYTPWNRAWMFANDPQNQEMGPYITGVQWAAALKGATAGRGGGGGQQAAGAPPPPPPPALSPQLSPTPGIESMSLHTVIQGSPDQQITIRGFNYVQRSVLYVDETPVPTRVVNRQEIQATIPGDLFGTAGKRHLTVRNPIPLATPDWGAKSNPGHILVPFSFTTQWSKGRY
jgi:imidazolonepropionase-like amidohydrolase